MTDTVKTREAIAQIIAEVVEQHSSAIRDEVMGRVAEHLEAIGSGASAADGNATDLLNAAVASVQDATSQADILKALLEGSTKFSQRSGLLVVRGAMATGWQARGFTDNEQFKSAVVDCSRGLGERVMKSRVPAAASAVEFDSGFVQRFGAPADGNVLLLPLVIKDKVAALVYVDGGALGSNGLDRSAMELLVRSTGNWLELVSFRKLNPTEASSQQEVAAAPAPAAYQSAPAQAMAAAAAAAPAYAAPATNTAPAAHEDETHNKARRFAKLLVEEIKLYNQAKVADGRANRDLYDRLKDDIDKSRATYEKRYGQVVTDVDYFTTELVRILADNDRAALGPNFR